MLLFPLSHDSSSQILGRGRKGNCYHPKEGTWLSHFLISTSDFSILCSLKSHHHQFFNPPPSIHCPYAFPCPLCLVMWSLLSLSNLCGLYQDNPCFADTSQKTTPLASTEKPQICLNQLLAHLYLYLHSSLTGGRQSDQQFCPSIC